MAPFRLCTIDLDGTLIRTTCFLTLAEQVGKAAEIRRLDAEYEAGRMSLAENFAIESMMFEGMLVAEAQAALRRGPWLRGIPEGVAALRDAGLRVGLLTDQPRFLAQVAEPTLDPLLCSEGGVKDGRIMPPIDYREDKAANLKTWCKANSVDLQEVIHCGNGTNDIPVFERVGLAVAVNPSSPEVARRADVCAEGVDDLRQLAEVVDNALRSA